MKRTTTGLAVMALAGVALVGCTKTEEGAGTGAFLGALAGQAIGGDTESTRRLNDQLEIKERIADGIDNGWFGHGDNVCN